MSVKEQYGLCCPECGADDELKLHIIIHTTAWLSVDGTDDEGGDHEFDENEDVHCAACGHDGPYHRFEVKNQGKRKFYVTMTWDNFPEGGSYGTVVNAVDQDDAEEQTRDEMASHRLDGVEPDDDEQSEAEARAEFRSNYEDEWHVIDCFILADFIEIHSKEAA